MRILYIDIDTLRPDHLGCYGYHRQTSPNIDAIARRAGVFENVHASDVPCLPSRTAVLTGRFGIHNGVVNHGGTDADPVIDGASREFWSRLHRESLPSQLKNGGAPFSFAKEQTRTVSISSFAQRHSAFHWYAGFDEAYNVGKYGLETADEVYALARDWLQRHAKQDHWFLRAYVDHIRIEHRYPLANPSLKNRCPAMPRSSSQTLAACGPHSARKLRVYAKPQNGGNISAPAAGIPGSCRAADVRRLRLWRADGR